MSYRKADRTVALISQARHTYEGERILPGQRFSATPQDAEDLIALNMVTLVPEELKKEEPKKPAMSRKQPTSSKRFYKRRDLAAEK